MKYEGFKISKESVDKLFPKGDIDILGYESPIQMLTNQFASEISKKADENIWEAVVKTEVVVDKDELVKALQYDRDQYEKGYINGYNAGLNADKWIGVDDRLPDKATYDWVLVNILFTECGEYGIPMIAEHRNGEWWDVLDNQLSDLDIKVTHWMPLPEPPEESENGKP